MASIVTGKIADAGGTCSIEYSATPSYVRNGSTVTITVKCSVYGWGKYYRAYLNGSLVIDSQDTTVYKTFTYNNAAAKTYSFPMEARLHTQDGRDEHVYYETASIYVPAYVPPGPQVYVNVNGTEKKASQVYIHAGGVWKPGTLKYKTGGVWK